ncbi:SusD-like starch-binding protein associating with outer membrane [Dyadobacter jejuensis]|uniref:SusD-like starch-binding protein associating with outer membrane n=1 Tax=Dyadobacter jejuensis TaxID=1082580 RepID=A0A316ASH9_9BACT|nr:SusD/RagB family nutrient-binding outer membrane lipoprotein [Dyadobacter jejuensis]PWJ60286.1 SusD-like starch-binding protein associating with outer membrane [Dyadobacter jejuensis]
MKKITYRSLLMGLMALLIANSCTNDFDEINSNPNSPTLVKAQYLLTTALEASVDRYWGSRTRFERINIDAAELYIQHLTRNILSNEGDNYLVSVSLTNNNWKGFYNDAQVNYQRIYDLSKADGTTPNTNYAGVALTMRSWVFMLLTDMYGPIPYSEAIKGTAEEPIYSPKYDDMEAIYAGLLNDLKMANELLTPSGPAIAGDILYNGDILKWKKFTNSLRLRIANRQAAKKPTESRAIFKEILDNPTTFPIFESNADNTQLNCSAVLPSNNEWNQVMIQDSRTDWNISKTFADKLNDMEDERITVFANPNSEGVYQGHANGLPDAIATNYLATSSTVGDYFTAATAPEVIMTYSELLFILAEAALDGDIDGDAEAYFQDAVAASFDQYGLTPSAAFLANLGPVSKENIMEQKWVSLFGQGIEAWTEWRRTGYPVFPPADSRAVFNNDGIRPTRFTYSTNEYSLNKINLEAGIQLLGGSDDMKTKLWWAE